MSRFRLADDVGICDMGACHGHHIGGACPQHALHFLERPEAAYDDPRDAFGRRGEDAARGQLIARRLVHRAYQFEVVIITVAGIQIVDQAVAFEPGDDLG